MSARLLRILVVEDNALIGMLLTEMIIAMGHEVCAIATTEAVAIAAAARHKPDLMIVDATLGEGSGVSAVREILRSGHVPHLFMSGARIQANSGDTVTLRKPFSESGLIDAMRRALVTRPTGASSASGTATA